MTGAEKELAMGNVRDNRYTVHQRLAASEARVTALEAELKDVRVHLKGALETAIADAKNHIQSAQAADFRDLKASIKDGVDGKDSTVPGPRGDVLYIGNEEVEPIVASLRHEIVMQRARYRATILQALADADGMHGMIFRRHLENLKREFGLD
jgi:hypothetical protein